MTYSMKDLCVQASCIVALLCAVAVNGCARRDNAPSGSVTNAWQQRSLIDNSSGRDVAENPSRSRTEVGGKLETSEPVVATVNGQPIQRRRVVDLLMQSRGVGVLEQLIGLETAGMALAERGLTVTQADIDDERDRALREFSDPLSSGTSAQFDRVTAERVLRRVLAQRSMSREEFNILTRRNAYLRKIIESQQVFTGAQLREEYDRVYGQRVRVRHIQLASLADVERVNVKLAAGEDFGESARAYSANTTSARNGGMIEPFSAADNYVPELLRNVAFSLTPGEVSSAIHVGQWYHLVKLEERLPARTPLFDEVRGELERSASERLSGPAMYRLYEKLFREANITIHDPVLAEPFNRKHKNRGS